MIDTISELLSAIKEYINVQNDSCNIDIQMTVRKCMNCLKDEATSCLSKEEQTEVKDLLLTLLRNAANPKETNLLSAISICLLLHRQPADSAATEYLTLLELPAELPAYHRQTLLLGLLSCDSHILLSATAQDGQSMVIHISRAVLQLCAAPYNVFQSFHLMSLLLQQLGSLSALPPVYVLAAELLSPAAAVLSSSWDRQCDGLPELLTRCWASLLQLHAQIQPDGGYVDQLLRPLALLPWSSKAKLHTLYVMSRHIGSEELVRRVPEITSGLAEAISGHHLASVTTDLYQELLMAATDEEQLIHLECQLASLLVSDDSQTRQTALLRWLPALVRCRPASGRRLLSLPPTDTSAGWAARLATVRLLREAGEDAGPDADPALLAGLQHADPAVRLVAAAACWPGRSATAAPPPPQLCEPLLRALVSCLCAESGSVRHALCAELRRLVPRLRTVCLRGRPPPEHLLRLLRDLTDAVLSGLSPASSYHRRSTCLMALQEIVSNLYPPHAPPGGTGTGAPVARKGIVPPQTATLLRYLSEHRPGGISWDFVTRDSLQALLLCLYDETDDVREAALRLLAAHWLPLLSTADCTRLADTAARLADRPNFHDVETAAALCRLVFEARRAATGQPPVQLLEDLLTAAQSQADGAKRDLYAASREAPVHGRLACLRRCLCGTGDAGLTAEMVDKCISLLQEVVDTMLKALAGHKEDECAGTAPSFAAMGEAVESVVTAAAAGDSAARSAALSSQFQLVLSCCWLCLKECCLFLGDLGARCLSPDGPGLAVLALRAVVDTVRRVLTGCRHKGAIESARVAWGRLSAAALRHDSAAVRAVPADALHALLDELSRTGARTSATRRAAGLPLLVHTLLAADRCPPGLADSTVTALLQVAAAPPPSPSHPDHASAGEADLPQTVALHILTGLMSDAVVSAQVTSRLCDVTCAALAGLASPIWSIRNASLVLYGAVVPRLVGQRKSRDDVSGHNSVAFGELFGRWPALAEPLLALLAAGGPALVAALTLLARVTAAGAAGPLLARYRVALVPLLGAPAAAVRQLTARCLAALLTDQQLGEQLQPAAGGCNRLHGQLLLARLVAGRAAHTAGIAAVCRRGLAAPTPAVQHLALVLAARAADTGAPLQLAPALLLARQTVQMSGTTRSWQPGHPLLFAASVQVLLSQPSSAEELIRHAAAAAAAEDHDLATRLTDPFIESAHQLSAAPSAECAVLCARRAGRLLASGSRGRRLRPALELALRHPDGVTELRRLTCSDAAVLEAFRSGSDLLPALAALAAASADLPLLRAACESTLTDSEPRRGQDARRDAACALGALWPAVAAADGAEAVEMRLYLLLAAAALLQDEEEDVRTPAAEWAAPLLCGRTPPEMVSSLLSECTSCASGPRLALRVVTPSPPVPKLVSAALSSGHQLFQPGPDNPSCEPSLLVTACAPIISTATGSEPELRQLWEQASETANLLASCRSGAERTRVLTAPGVFASVECLDKVMELQPPPESEFPALAERVARLLADVRSGTWLSEEPTAEAASTHGGYIGSETTGTVASA